MTRSTVRLMLAVVAVATMLALLLYVAAPGIGPGGILP